jgi:hypothetical protein
VVGNTRRGSDSSGVDEPALPLSSSACNVSPRAPELPGTRSRVRWRRGGGSSGGGGGQRPRNAQQCGPPGEGESVERHTHVGGALRCQENRMGAPS